MILNKEYNEKNWEYLKNAVAGKEYRVMDEDGVEIAARTDDPKKLDAVLDVLPFNARGLEIKVYSGATKKGPDTRFFFHMETGKGKEPSALGFGSLERERAKENTEKEIELVKLQFRVEALTEKNKQLEKDCKEMAEELAANDSKGGALAGLDLGQIVNMAAPMIVSKLMGGAPAATLAGPGAAAPARCRRCAELEAKAGPAYENVCMAAEMLAEDPLLMEKFNEII